MEFSRYEYWSGLLFPTPGDFPDLGIEHESSVSPVLAGGFFTSEPPGKPPDILKIRLIKILIGNLPHANSVLLLFLLI